MFRPRRSARAHRYVYWQVGLFFLAASVWGIGVIRGIPQLTGVSIGLLLVALILGAIGRRGADGSDG